MQPNVIMILIDDLGWMDLSCQGSSFYETPHIDQLRREGMAFDQAYAACPVCSPSRASILSGKYPARLKVTDWIDHENYHPCRGKLIDAPYIQGAVGQRVLDGESVSGSRLSDLACRKMASGKRSDVSGASRL